MLRVLANLRKDLAEVEQQSSELTTRWQNERDKIEAEGRIKEELDAARLELEQAERSGDLARAGELSYGTIPELEKKLAEAEDLTEDALLREEVTLVGENMFLHCSVDHRHSALLSCCRIRVLRVVIRGTSGRLSIKE